MKSPGLEGLGAAGNSENRRLIIRILETIQPGFPVLIAQLGGPIASSAGSWAWLQILPPLAVQVRAYHFAPLSLVPHLQYGIKNCSFARVIRGVAS